jgi:Icc-related predicted phosphoesterase
MVKRETVRIGAVADLHYTATSQGALKLLFERAAKAVDVLLLGGDLTDLGRPEEAKVLAADLAGLGRLPVVAVLGNHDYEAGKQDEVTAILREAGVTMLDGDACEIRGIGIGGAKGFMGGFGRGTLEPWGEEAVKRLVHEAVEEALKLERALSRLRTPQRIALLHYAPVRDTVAGEPEEIFPFMGCSRLEEPLNRYQVAAAFHGHAHRGSPEGRTSSGIPVYNVALSLIRRGATDLPLRVLEIAVTPSVNDPVPAAKQSA